jgi:hypothetical protein
MAKHMLYLKLSMVPGSFHSYHCMNKYIVFHLLNANSTLLIINVFMFIVDYPQFGLN